MKDPSAFREMTDSSITEGSAAEKGDADENDVRLENGIIAEDKEAQNALDSTTGGADLEQNNLPEYAPTDDKKEEKMTVL